MTKPPPVGRAYSGRYRAWLLLLLAASYACSYIDRIIIAVVGPAVMADLDLGDLEFGLLGGLAFAVFYSLVGVPIATLADRMNRKTIIAVSIAGWSLMTMAGGMATHYWQLFASRVGVGIGEAGHVPAAHSLIADMYPPDGRPWAVAVFSVGAPAGALVGAIAAGALADAVGWQWTLVIAGAPGLFLAALFWWTVHEPVRERLDAARVASGRGAALDTVRHMARVPTLRHVVIGGVLATLTANGINVFAPTYLMRTFNLSLSEAGLWFGLLLGISGITGMLVGGSVVARAVRVDPRWYGWLPGITLITAMPFYVAAYRQSSLELALTFWFVGAALLATYFPVTFAAAQSLSHPAQRASTSAILLALMNLIGQGLGPVTMGWMSDRFATRAFEPGDYRLECLNAATPSVAACSTAAATGLRLSLLIVTVGLIWGGVHFLIASRTARRDLAAPPPRPETAP